MQHVVAVALATDGRMRLGAGVPFACVVIILQPLALVADESTKLYCKVQQVKDRLKLYLLSALVRSNPQSSNWAVKSNGQFLPALLHKPYTPSLEEMQMRTPLKTPLVTTALLCCSTLLMHLCPCHAKQHSSVV
jgi:hypothetical protein